MRKIIFALYSLVIFFPAWISAAGLVPCGGEGEPSCTACHVRLLIQNIMDWLVVILGLIAVLSIVVSGIYMAVSRGNPAAAQWAKKRIFNALLGYAIVLASWMIIDVILKVGVDGATYGVWNSLVCP